MKKGRLTMFVYAIYERGEARPMKHLTSRIDAIVFAKAKYDSGVKTLVYEQKYEVPDGPRSLCEVLDLGGLSISNQNLIWDWTRHTPQCA